MAHPLFYAGGHGCASIPRPEAQGLAAVAVPAAGFRPVSGGLRGSIPVPVRLPATGHPGSREQVPGLRRPGARLRPHTLRSLPPRVSAGLLVQGSLVLPFLPPEESAALRGAGY